MVVLASGVVTKSGKGMSWGWCFRLLSDILVVVGLVVVVYRVV